MPSIPRGDRSPERSELLRRRFLEGDNAAFEELLSIYMPLLKFIAKKYCSERDDRDDCLAEAVLGFLRAVRTYDARRGSMDNYIALVASHRLIDMARRASGSRVELSADLDQQVGALTEDSVQSGMADMVALATTLSGTERACFERYLAGESLSEIAQELKVTKASVSNALARAKRKLGKALS
ncbi:MAG: sigma-70 family RNA polymerase sigma factor [Candidatus Cryosericum sp.]